MKEKKYIWIALIQNILQIFILKIKEYLSGSSLLDKFNLIDLEELIIQYSSLYDIYYESDDEDIEFEDAYY